MRFELIQHAADTGLSPIEIIKLNKSIPGSVGGLFSDLVDGRKKTMVTAEISITPVGTETSSASEYIARAIKAIVGQTNLKYQLTAMGTILEGDLNDVLDAAKRMHEGVFSQDVQRVLTSITIDDRRDKNLPMDQKVESVMEKIR